MTKGKAIFNIVMAVLFFILFVVTGYIGIYSIAYGKGVTLINTIAVICTGYTVIDKLYDIYTLFPEYREALRKSNLE